ncbi:hypothetical protein F0L74_06005 [Chitinophaga agrisoli]|uniref:Uncharacterized protein n=1 Tax=Chitinophaga agrisoli TaxID=2607653 RepID=A0A5B2W470_9BACT|nr:hypothetical protein [Chitinophaga agrisoli]KAA2245510.1 hypothetical protein F0L74_06005 [Chitinophaga agrisoli]
MPSKGHLAKLHILLKETRNQEQKADMVLGFTGGRTASSASMTDAEAVKMITHLEEIKVNIGMKAGGRNAGKIYEATNTMKFKIIGLAIECGWTKDGGKIDIGRLNDWCIRFGANHKRLDDHTYMELPALVTQFENGPYLARLKKS